MKRFAVWCIRLYQRYGRGLHNRQCIYTPTCSEYGVLVIDQHGLIRGMYYTYARICRCNGALYQGGEDWP